MAALRSRRNVTLVLPPRVHEGGEFVEFRSQFVFELVVLRAPQFGSQVVQSLLNQADDQSDMFAGNVNEHAVTPAK
ncbi:MAG: hypothetical protein ACKPEY_20755 [Planctomycetota bacterium]